MTEAFEKPGTSPEPLLARQLRPARGVRRLNRLLVWSAGVLVLLAVAAVAASGALKKLLWPEAAKSVVVEELGVPKTLTVLGGDVRIRHSATGAWQSIGSGTYSFEEATWLHNEGGAATELSLGGFGVVMSINPQAMVFIDNIEYAVRDQKVVDWHIELLRGSLSAFVKIPPESSAEFHLHSGRYDISTLGADFSAGRVGRFLYLECWRGALSISDPDSDFAMLLRGGEPAIVLSLDVAMALDALDEAQAAIINETIEKCRPSEQQRGDFMMHVQKSLKKRPEEIDLGELETDVTRQTDRERELKEIRAMFRFCKRCIKRKELTAYAKMHTKWPFCLNGEWWLPEGIQTLLVAILEVFVELDVEYDADKEAVITLSDDLRSAFATLPVTVTATVRERDWKTESEPLSTASEEELVKKEKEYIFLIDLRKEEALDEDWKPMGYLVWKAAELQSDVPERLRKRLELMGVWYGEPEQPPLPGRKERPGAAGAKESEGGGEQE